jgi:SAM-dependent methyltransferase
MRCVVCGSDDYDIRYEARLPDPDTLDFAARRSGQHFHPRIVECRHCGQVYSNPFFSNELITKLYREAGYITEPQLTNMTRDYLGEFKRAVGSRDSPNLRILEVGCANGFFLHALKQAGYQSLRGVEPGQEAVAGTAPEIRPHVLNDFFGPDTFPAQSFDVVCCFQVMDHMPDPALFVRAVHNVLAPQGIFLAINHDIRAAITRLLGEKSPMYDVEHIFLFDRTTMTRLLANAGFSVVACRTLYNSYTMDYAIKMFPLPTALKRGVGRMISALGMASISFRVPGGNMVTVARRDS